MREIPLGKGLVALIDDADYARVSSRKWYLFERKGLHYAITDRPERYTLKKTLMHRFIMGAGPRLTVHHVNGDGLCNTRDNLLLLPRDVHGFLHVSPQRCQVRSDEHYHSDGGMNLCEAAEALNLSRQRIHQIALARHIGVQVDGRHWQFTPQEVGLLRTERENWKSAIHRLNDISRVRFGEPQLQEA